MRKRKERTCADCGEEMDNEAKCSNCKNTFHPSCMQNYNRKPLCRDCKKSNKKKHGGEFEDASEVVFMTSDFESGRFFVDEEIEDDDDHDQLTFSESDPEVYEEPDTSDGEGDEIMLEIVQERLVQGWSSSSDDESELEELFTPEMVPVPAPVPQKLELDNDIEELLQVETVEPMEPIDLQKEEKPLSFDIKKTQIVNGEIVSTTKSIKWQPGQQTPAPPKKKNPPKKQPQKTPVANNQWLAMAALNMSNQKPKPTPPKTPLNLTSVASAAAALMANPAALKALTELRKTQLSKIQKEKKKEPPQQDITKTLESLVSLIQRGSAAKKQEPQKKEEEDILDLLEVDNLESVETMEEIDEHGFSRFRKIPIGTFWKSQRVARNRQKKSDLHKAVKKSPAAPSTLNSTLLVRKQNPLMSPQLIPIQSTPVKPVELGDFGLDVPPPLTPY